MNYFASGYRGAITLLTYAKSLFTAPVALARRRAPLRFPFWRRFSPRTTPKPSPGMRIPEFVPVAFSLLLILWMICLAFPLVDLIFRGGFFLRNSAHEMALYFAIFSISLCFGRHKRPTRALDAAGNTLAPMVAGTIIVLISLPIYSLLYRAQEQPDWRSPRTSASSYKRLLLASYSIAAKWFDSRGLSSRNSAGLLSPP